MEADNHGVPDGTYVGDGRDSADAESAPPERDGHGVRGAVLNGRHGARGAGAVINVRAPADDSPDAAGVGAASRLGARALRRLTMLAGRARLPLSGAGPRTIESSTPGPALPTIESGIRPAPAPAPADDIAEGAFAAVVIERNDDLASIFGKINAADSPRVALVAPHGNRLLGTTLGMRRLQRHLDLSGRDLVLVTHAHTVRLRAREEGVPATGSLRHVTFDRPAGGLHLGWVTLRMPSAGSLLALAVFVTIAALGAAVLFWYVPSATIALTVPAETVSDTVEIIADTKASDVNVAKGVVPAHRREVTITRTIPGPTTGVVLAPGERAAVGLTFTNRTGRAVTVPKGTAVRTAAGVGFTVGSDVDLPARSGATGDGIALAQQAGAAGNVARGTVTRIEGSLAEQVAVTNPQPGEKGTDIKQAAVSDADVAFLREIATTYLGDAARNDILARYAGSATVFRDGEQVEITDCAPSPAVGQVARYLELSCTARVSLLTVDEADLRRVYVDRLRPKIAPDRMLIDDAFKTEVDRPGQFDATFDRLTIAVRASDLAAPYVDRAGLREELAGKSRGAADDLLRHRIESAAPARIDLPGWAPWLPKRANRITITVQPAP